MVIYHARPNVRISVLIMNYLQEAVNQNRDAPANDYGVGNEKSV